MKTPFQSCSPDLIPWFLSRVGKARKESGGDWEGEQTTEQTARRERPHLPQEVWHSGLRPADPERSTEPGRRRGPDAAPCPCRPHPVVPAEGFLHEPEGHATPEKGGLREAAGRREAEAWAAVQLGCFKLTACPQRRGNAQDRAGARALESGRAASLTCATSCAAWPGPGPRRAPALGAWPLHPRDRLIWKHVADPMTTTALWTARSWGLCRWLGLGSEAAGWGRGEIK